MRTGCDLRNGFVGGESGFSAASSFRNCDEASADAVEADGVEDEGEKMKVRNPNASRAARTRVMEFVRRRVTTAMVVLFDRTAEEG